MIVPYRALAPQRLFAMPLMPALSLAAALLGTACSSDGDGADVPEGVAGSESLSSESDDGDRAATQDGDGDGDGEQDPQLPPGVDWLLDESAPPDSSRPSWATLTNPVQPTAFWGSSAAPLPTNTWWLGLVLEDGDATVFPYPYYLRANESGFDFGLPYKVVAENSVGSGVGVWTELGSVESPGTREVTTWDDLSVTMEWVAADGSMSAPVVAGMPYATMVFEGLTPRTSLSGLSGTGTRFEVTDAGTDYVVYTSSEVSFVDGAASAPLNGWVRIAVLPEAAAKETLDAHASAVPLRGQVELSSAGSTGIIELGFETQEGDAPLMMTLPHHRDLLQDAELAPVEMDTIKGMSQGVVASSWTLHLELGDVSFGAPRPIDATMGDELRAQLAIDASYDPETGGDSVYWSGKNLSKLARLLLIAEELGETEIQDTLLSRLKTKVEAWLGDDSALAYDTVWGGVVNGCVGTNVDCDFGQGVYSDHHFHYGYHVYAAAVVAKLDPAWVDTWGQAVEWMIRDYANPYKSDSQFTRFRHFDFYSGHSWTSGLINFGSGRNQESTSEAVHAYYAVQLWGEATGSQDLEQVGKILRIGESLGAQKYWQIRDESEIYDAPFSSNPVVGIVWNDKVDFATWFGTGDDNEYIAGIQMIPITPASEDLLSPQWVDEAWDRGLETMADSLGTEDGWRDFIAAAVAGWDRNLGCEMIHEQTGHDGGNSKTNMLHYCATR